MRASPVCIFFITIQIIYVVTAQEMDKRLPQGFFGMRGKKYIESGENEFNKRKPHFFVGVKGKKDFETQYNPDFEYKRAPMGFVGMRGKKDLLYPEFTSYPYPESYAYVPQKTGSLVGQIDYSTDDNNYNAQEYPILNEAINDFLQKLQSNEEIDANTGIDNSNEMTNAINKRAKMHQFYGVRGKKSIPEKRPYDVTFRGKFIGVRGKKDGNNTGKDMQYLLNGPWGKRRGQMGFVGMRGKKWTDDGTSEEVILN